MKRADGLYDISRRSFLGAVGAGAALTACGGSDTASPDAPTAAVDAPAGATCAAGATDVGAPTAFMMNVPVLNSAGRFFVVRDAGGLYAMSAACTHEGVTTCVGTGASCSASGTQIFCPRHGALFKFDGTVVRGPASAPLPHLSVCLLANGHVGVIPTKVVAATVRLVA